MIHLLMQNIIPLIIFYFGPLIFGLVYINKQTKLRKITDRSIWIIFLVLMPIIAISIFYFTMVRPKIRDK